MMNLPNKLTVARMCLVPVFLFFIFGSVGILTSSIYINRYLIALAVFALASLTDLIDGMIARRHNLVTDFGKLMDPLADKVLVMAAMVSLIGVGLIHPVVVIVILTREFLISAIRQIAASGGHVLAADNWGKIKTVSQMVWICLLLLYAHYFIANTIFAALPEYSYTPSIIAESVLHVVEIIVVVLTVYSGLNYTWKNRKLFANI